MKKILKVALSFVLIMCIFICVSCEVSSNIIPETSLKSDSINEGTDILNTLNNEQNSDSENKENSNKEVLLNGKPLSEYMVVTDLVTNSAGVMLNKKLSSGTDAKINLQCSITDMRYYSNIPYIYIATLPINGELYELQDDEVKYYEENGNFNIILGSRKITEADAVNYFINTIMTSNSELKGFTSMVEMEKNEILTSVIEEANTTANKILNTENQYSAADVKNDGKCYFVSYSQGSDLNDGLSEEKPWKTVTKVNNENIAAGSVVLFKRGDIWRFDDYSKSNNAGYLFLKSDVIYSSYGEGNKPAIYGSPRNAAAVGTWTETDTKNVWKYSEKYTGMSVDYQNDVGNIIFNNGEAYGYKMITGKEGFNGDLHELDENYKFWYNTSDDFIYLYFDGGNPSEKFESIEIGVRINLVRISKASNIIFDNFSIKYGGAHGIAVALTTNLRISNCEICWMGGGVYSYNTTSAARYGNGIELNRDCSTIVIDMNNIYQIYDAGITHQYDSRSNPNSRTTCYFEDINYTNNVIENCFYGIEYFVSASINYPDTERYMKDITISGNYFLYAGYGWGYWRPSKAQPGAAFIKGWEHTDKLIAGKITVENNNFVLSMHDMIYSVCENESDISDYKNNCFIQYENHKTITVCKGIERIDSLKRELWDPKKLSENPYLKNKNNTFITIK